MNPDKASRMHGGQFAGMFYLYRTFHAQKMTNPFLIVALLASFLLTAAHAQEKDTVATQFFERWNNVERCENPRLLTWGMLHKTTFQESFEIEINAYLLCPNFPAKLMEKDNTCVKISGYLVVQNGVFFLQSMGNLYACEASPMDVIEVSMASVVKIDLRTPIPCRIQGILRLNDTDIDHMNFQLHSATFLPLTD